MDDATSKPEILSAMDESPLAIHHVGVAVPSIDDAMHFYGDKLGLSVVDSLELPDRQLKVAFVQAAKDSGSESIFIWIPGGALHSIKMTGALEGYGAFLAPDVDARLPATCCAVSVTPLLRELLFRTAKLPLLLE